MKSFKKSFFLNTCAERMNIDTNSFKQNIFQQLLADTGIAIYWLMIKIYTFVVEPSFQVGLGAS